ncbi:MAG TPA: hypothetical protein VE287_07535 [Actinopolymorphaceae bacterium]|nr:hypothetical protein [Actinopolymorphaceae bacterium]
MGDKTRAEEFALFVATTFPAATRIADVAGGHGVLSYWLRELGFDSVLIEPRPAPLPRWIRRDLRKRAIRDGYLTTIDRITRPVEEVELADFDAVLAMHPDQATEPAVRAAVKHGLGFAIVPCCVFALDGTSYSYQDWLAYLASLAPGCRTSTLPITGANVVLWRTSTGSDDGSE